MTPDPWCTAAMHGTRRDYLRKTNRCRCQTARDELAAYGRQRWLDLREGRPRTIDATGTRRRLQALKRAGWSETVIGARLYVSQSTVQYWSRRPTITPRNAQRVADLYDQIGLDEGNSYRTRSAAEAHGWPTPIEWGDNIDDPKAKPLNLDVVHSPADPRSAPPLEDVELVVTSGGTWETTAARLGTSRTNLERRLYRAKRRDLVDRLYRNSETWSSRDYSAARRTA